MKIQPINSQPLEWVGRVEPVKPAMKSRLKRLFERQFTSVLRNSSAEKICDADEPHSNKEGLCEFEPSSVCLAKMVQNFIEESNGGGSSSSEKQAGAVRCGRNCFNGNYNDSSEDELDSFGVFGDSNLSSSGEACDILKSLVLCASVSERNLLADTWKIVEKNKICKRKDDLCRKTVSEGLLGLGYDAAICKSRWEKSPSYPAGEYEYMDVIIEGERLLIDIDFRSEFEIARSTKIYKSILQTLPYIFVGKADRMQKIVSLVSEAAKQSLKKKGMPVPPWRKADYVKAKWLSPHNRATSNPAPTETLAGHETKQSVAGLFDFNHGNASGEENKAKAVVKEWKPPEIKPKSSHTGVRLVTGLASVIED